MVFAAARVNRASEAMMLRDLMPEAYQIRRKVLTSAVASSLVLGRQLGDFLLVSVAVLQ